MTDKKNQPSRTTKTVEELQKASKALYYEIWMFNEMVKSLLTQPPQSGNPQYNALVESFVQHARNLIEFFYPSDNVRQDTIIASDFFIAQNQWVKKIPSWLDNERTDAHKFLAHLTYDRIENEKRWDYPRISQHINAIFFEFFEKAPQDRFGEKLKNFKVPPANVVTLKNEEDLIRDHGLTPDGQVMRIESIGPTASTGVDTLPGATVFSADLFSPRKS